MDIPIVIIPGKFAVLIKRDDDAQGPFYRGADHVCPEAGGIREAGRGSLPTARGKRAILLPLEAEVPRDRDRRAPEASPGMPGRELVHVARRCEDEDRGVAERLQRTKAP